MTKISSTLADKDAILALLSDAEIGKVSMAETKRGMPAGDQFIDLNNLAAGLQTAREGGASVTDDIIPRSAVHPNTWMRIIEKLQAS